MDNVMKSIHWNQFLTKCIVAGTVFVVFALLNKLSNFKDWKEKKKQRQKKYTEAEAKICLKETWKTADKLNTTQTSSECPGYVSAWPCDSASCQVYLMYVQLYKKKNDAHFITSLLT